MDPRPHPAGTNVHIGAPPQAAAPAPANARTASAAAGGPSPSSAGASSSKGNRSVGDYIVEYKIGSGSFASVWKAHHRSDPSVLRAIKSVSREKLLSNRKHEENLAQEIDIMSKIQHRNIVRLYEVKPTERHQYLILEYCAGGDLSKFIRKHGALGEAASKPFFGQLAAGMRFLRTNNLIHRDLKPQNLLLDADAFDARVLIADFGFARAMDADDDMAATLCGSPLYMAPEILDFKSYDASVDLWSVGAILFEMITGRPPFTGANHVELLKRIKSTPLSFPADIKLSKECQHLLLNLLRRNPRERISFDMFFQHPWVVESMQIAEEARRRKEEATGGKAGAQAAAQAIPVAASATPQPQPLSSTPPPAQPAALAAPLSGGPLSSRADKSLSSTPPGQQQLPPHLLQQQQRANNSNLYGSSPAQNAGYMPAQFMSPQHAQPITSPYVQPQRYSPGLPSVLSGSPPAAYATSLPTQHNHAATQHYQKPPQPQNQQIGFNAPSQAQQRAYSPLPNSPPHSQQQPQQQPQAGVPYNNSVHPPRPISRHNTPNSLRNSHLQQQPPQPQPQDGSASSGSYVVVDENSSSGVGAGGGGGGVAQSSPKPVVDWAAEYARVQKEFKLASSVAVTADRKLAALRMPHAVAQISEAAQLLVLSLVDDVEDASNEPLIKDTDLSHASTMLSHSLGPGVSSPHANEQLAAILSIYIKFLEKLSALVGSAKGALEAIAVPSSESSGDWQAAHDFLAHKFDLYMSRASLVRTAMRDLSALEAADAVANRVSIAGAGAGAAAGAISVTPHSRRGSASVAPQSANASFILDSSAAPSPANNSGGGPDDSPASAVLASTAALLSSRLLSMPVPASEANVWLTALSYGQSAFDQEFLGNHGLALREYKETVKLLEFLQGDPGAAGPDDQAKIAQFRRKVEERVRSCEAANKASEHSAQAQTHTQQTLTVN